MAKGGKKAGSGASKSVSAAAVKVQEDVWAQCDNPNCQKWRRLPPGTVIDENTPWYCYMNPDEENAACEAPRRTHSGGNSQGTKRRPDSDARLDSTYDSKRARLGTSAKSAEANGHSSPGKHEADAGTAPDLQGTSSGGLRHSLRPRRPPSYPLKEESPPPPGPSRHTRAALDMARAVPDRPLGKVSGLRQLLLAPPRRQGSSTKALRSFWPWEGCGRS
ncbi:hypothetical protein WJX79_000395 [Trebouxia sp. C0005]